MYQIKLNDRFKQFFGTEGERIDLERKDHIQTTNRYNNDKNPFSQGVNINSTFVTNLSGSKDAARKLRGSI